MKIRVTVVKQINKRLTFASGKQCGLTNSDNGTYFLFVSPFWGLERELNPGPPYLEIMDTGVD